jgi:lipopolysaccharide export LptBFGC system permease protein LptF
MKSFDNNWSKDIKYLLTKFFSYLLVCLSIFLIIFILYFIEKNNAIILNSELNIVIKLKVIFFNIPWMLSLALTTVIIPAILLLVKNNLEKYNKISAESDRYSILNIFIPVLICNASLSIILFVLLSFVVPEANHQARILFMDVNSFLSDTSANKTLKMRGDSYRGDRELNLISLYQRIDDLAGRKNLKYEEVCKEIDTYYSDDEFKNALQEKIYYNEDFDESFIQKGVLKDTSYVSDIIRIQKKVKKARSLIYSYTSSINRDKIEVHKKYSISFEILFLTIFIFPFSLLFKKIGIGKIIGFAMLFSFLVWSLQLLGEDYADQMKISVWLGMWLVNIILGVSGLLVFLLIRNKYTLRIKYNRS